MRLNDLARKYEEDTIELKRKSITEMLKNHLPPLESHMKILDLACGSGSVTRVIYELCKERGVEPPSIFGIDIGDNFIHVYNEYKEEFNWHTAEASVGDASNLDTFQDNHFDFVIMSFGLFAVANAVADKTAQEIHRVLKPGGRVTLSTWQENFFERVLADISRDLGRPEEEWAQRAGGKWLKMETGRDTLLAGGFKPEKVHHDGFAIKIHFTKPDELVDQFDNDFWRGLLTSNWDEGQKAMWRSLVEKQITEEEKAKGEVPADVWIFDADK